MFSLSKEKFNYFHLKLKREAMEDQWNLPLGGNQREKTQEFGEIKSRKSLGLQVLVLRITTENGVLSHQYI